MMIKKNISFLAIFLLALSGCVQPPVAPAPATPTYVYVGDNWRALDSLTPPVNSIQLAVQAPEEGTLDQKIQFQVTPNDNGYLWIVQIDANDQVQLLFPNNEEPENYIRVGNTITLPGRSGYYYYLDRPLGQNLLAFIITSEKDGISQVLPPRIKDVLYKSRDSRRFIRGVKYRQQQDWGVTKHVITVR
ncbi:MAG: DUF4384 domain-containing protein [Candidatus Competibacteraceae bacterium]|nr:DUF4384 domain-containing protein [Candidatus Competibacteraceae bacterium]